MIIYAIFLCVSENPTSFPQIGLWVSMYVLDNHEMQN